MDNTVVNYMYVHCLIYIAETITPTSSFTPSTSSQILMTQTPAIVDEDVVNIDPTDTVTPIPTVANDASKQ